MINGQLMIIETGTSASTGWGWKWPAPAKLNLMLRITGRRSDGYHLLQTVFQIIDLCDWLKFQPHASKITLEQAVPGIPNAENLVIRAAELLKKEAGYSGGVSIDIEKNLPMGGGLGGGSSDAATTLVVLNKLWDLNLSVQQLMGLGISLGADVPIFIYGYTAWAEGIGEHLQKIDIPEKYFLIIRPDVHVNTREVFLTEALTRDSKSIRMGEFLAGQQQNDCLEVVRNKYPLVDEALFELGKFGKAKLTGTGSCVFAQFDNEKSGQKAYEVLKDSWQTYFVKGLSVSPLLEKLKQAD